MRTLCRPSLLGGRGKVASYASVFTPLASSSRRCRGGEASNEAQVIIRPTLTIPLAPPGICLAILDGLRIIRSRDRQRWLPGSAFELAMYELEIGGEFIEPKGLCEPASWLYQVSQQDVDPCSLCEGGSHAEDLAVL